MHWQWLFIFFAIFFSGCSSQLPNRSVPLSNFIPSNDPTVVFSASECNWYTLGRVVDGDTIVLQNGEKVRFTGVDAPEDGEKVREKFGTEATQFVSDALTPGEKICLISDEIGDKRDKYDRILAYIFDESGFDVNAEIIRAGLAEYYRSFPYTRKEEFKNLERLAKKEKLGQWK